MSGHCIAILGAESTGKTALAQALAQGLAVQTGQRCTWVGEHLRAWCAQHGRTPRADEQMAIAQQQQAQVDAAAAEHGLVICDTTPLMTAVYSQLIFGDASLMAYGVAQQRRYRLTLLTSLDLPWVADGLQRDGPQLRLPVDAALRSVLAEHGLPWVQVAGQGQARVQAAMAALVEVLLAPQSIERP